MNRIILIGNGFDLAHDLKTSYNSFIDNYWEKVIDYLKNNDTSIYKDNKIYINFRINYNDKKINNFKTLKRAIDSSSNQYNYYELKFKNNFFKIINDKKTLQNWVDIENEYYNLLLKIIENNKKYNIDSLDEINKLNSEFKVVENLLAGYLKKELEKKNLEQKEEIYTKIYSDIKYDDLSEKIKSNFNSNTLRKIYRNPPENILFLSFNYTNLEKLYIKDKNKENTEVIHIHGTLDKEDNNPIIFGFGDELDDNYNNIEKLNQNEYLENIKSIKYLETDNYKKLLEFLNSDDYQLFIFGHSCGVSDRTLLNTIFEHKNCGSIKLFYHQKKKYNHNSNEYETFDNYSDIIRNISRNFNNKVEMRSKVVNKKYCKPLIKI